MEQKKIDKANAKLENFINNFNVIQLPSKQNQKSENRPRAQSIKQKLD